jgi:hypothetical protein
MFRNLPFCESRFLTIPAPPQGFANLSFSRGKIGRKGIKIAQIGATMIHTKWPSHLKTKSTNVRVGD